MAGKMIGRSRTMLCRMMMLITVLYLLLVWLAYRQAERALDQQQKSGHIFKPSIKLDGVQLFAKTCPISVRHQHGHVSGPLNSDLVKELKPGMCQAKHTPQPPNIQMEKEWSSISVGYPQYVYTVTGWIQVLDVPNYTPRPLKVIIMPHSHQDPGWKQSFETYYKSESLATLNNIVSHLVDHPSWKFIWAEISFLQKWYEEASGIQKEQLKSLLRRGQLEIVTGGWVMTDEAVAHYAAMLDQLIEGHIWLKEKLNISPNVSWSVDPFGHSPTMTYLLKKSGIDHMVIQRVHFGVKKHFALQRKLEFVWKQAWDAKGDTGVFCHMMPFLLYAIQYSCGPDPHVCCQFDFHNAKCFQGTKKAPRVEVNDGNIRKLAWSLWEQLQKKAQLYKSNVLLVPHGDDFTYSQPTEWVNQFGNLEKLMNYMNKNSEMNIQLEFGTLSDYFKAVRDDTNKSRVTFPSLTGDFFPYNDRDDQYWTGYYTSRPLAKYLGRVLQAKLRVTDILLTLNCAQMKSELRHLFVEKSVTLSHIRQTLALFQHHDTITGTSREVVMKDYTNRLRTSIAAVEAILRELMFMGVARWEDNIIGIPVRQLIPPDLKMEEVASGEKNKTKKDQMWHVVVTNPLTIPWKSVVKVLTFRPCMVTNFDGKPVPSQVNPVFTDDLMPDMSQYEIAFEADLPALSVKTYVLKESYDVDYASLQLFGGQINPTNFREFRPLEPSNEMVEIENSLLRATFSTCTGTLQFTHHKHEDLIHQTSIKFVKYGTGSWTNPFKDKSGAYIFMPDAPAKEDPVFYPQMIVLQGPVMSTVMTKLPAVIHKATLYNISGPVAAGVHIQNTVNILDKKWDNTELALRIESDVVSPDTSICVDLNGFQMHKKSFKSKLLTQGNFHPMTTMAFLEDSKYSRLSLITASTHGVASLNHGWLEVMLDRRLMQDDWRGLNEGNHDNVATPSEFMLVPENRDSPGQTKGPGCYPSLLAHQLSTHISNQPQLMIIKGINKTDLQPQKSFLKQGWPDHYDLVTLRPRMEVDNGIGALLVLHRAGLDCAYSQVYSFCYMKRFLSLNSFSEAKLKSAQETTLTGNQKLIDLDKFFMTDLEEMELKTFNVTFR